MPTPPPLASQKTPEGYHARIKTILLTFFMTLYTLFYSVARHVMNIYSGISSLDSQNVQEVATGTVPKDELYPPSPTSKFTETELLSSVLKRLGELEEKMDTLKAKPSEMPHEKEELLNAAVCRVDALEAELIATKKVKSLMRSLFCLLVYYWFLFKVYVAEAVLG